MAEYIEREALEMSFNAATMAFLEKEDLPFDRKSVLAGMSIAAGIVHTVPTADVAQVVRGRWIERTVRGSPAIVCSQCMIDSGISYRFNYCPNCGAKLDLEEP